MRIVYQYRRIDDPHKLAPECLFIFVESIRLGQQTSISLARTTPYLEAQLDSCDLLSAGPKFLLV
jgi:hypothetical protein